MQPFSQLKVNLKSFLEEQVFKSSAALHAHLEGTRRHCGTYVSVFLLNVTPILSFSFTPLSRTYSPSLLLTSPPLSCSAYLCVGEKQLCWETTTLVSFYSLTFSLGNHTFSTSPPSVLYLLLSAFERYKPTKWVTVQKQRSPACLKRKTGKGKAKLCFIIDFILKACTCEAKSILCTLSMLLKAVLRANHGWSYKEKHMA